MNNPFEPCKSPFCIFNTEKLDTISYTPCIHLDLSKPEMRILLRQLAKEYLRLKETEDAVLRQQEQIRRLNDSKDLRYL